MLSMVRLQIIPKSTLIQSILSINGPVRGSLCIPQRAVSWTATWHNSSILHSLSQHTLLTPAAPLTLVRHNTNFFNKHTGDNLWKGVVSVSKYGARKGRGRGVGKKVAKNLNRGQVIGVGEINMVWPGLNAPILRGQELVQRQELEPDPDRQRKLQEIRDRMGQYRRRRVNPLERGWSGTKMGGKKMGPPDAIEEDTFEGFESICLEFKVVSVMKGSLGRMRSVSVFTVTGNGNGLAGFALAKAPMPQTAIRVSKNKAAQHLMRVPIYDNHTVMHDFYTQFGITKIFVKQMPKGFGLVCHRAIKAICEMVGIKDLHAKIEGSVNVQNLTKAFFLGLMRQKTYQQLAEEKGLHVVELRKENFNYPKVLASPILSPVRTEQDILPSENLDFNIHVMENRVKLDKEPKPHFYTFTVGWKYHLKKQLTLRNIEKVRRQLLMEYGVVKSFHHDKYPECITDFHAHRKIRHYDAHRKPTIDTD